MRKKTKKKREKRGCRIFPHFWLFYILGLYSLLFVCFNKHTRTSVQKKATLSNCVCKFMFGQKFSLQIAPQKKNCLKGSLTEEKVETDQRFAQVGRVLRCHRACHVTTSKYNNDRNIFIALIESKAKTPPKTMHQQTLTFTTTPPSLPSQYRVVAIEHTI